jgi:hypothetical protein
MLPAQLDLWRPWRHFMLDLQEVSSKASAAGSELTSSLSQRAFVTLFAAYLRGTCTHCIISRP